MNWKKFNIISGAVACVLTIGILWSSLELPRPAIFTEVQAVQEYAESEIKAVQADTSREFQKVQQYAGRTREIVLNQEWFRLKSQIREIQAKLDRNPGNSALIRELTRLEQTLRAVNADLSELR